MANKGQILDLTFPNDTAGPNEVRYFIQNVLITKHDMKPSDAAEMAKKWGLGRGHDFRRACGKIFGLYPTFGFNDAGPIRDSIEEIRVEAWENGPQARRYHYAMRIALALGAVIACIGVFNLSPLSIQDILTIACLPFAGAQIFVLGRPDDYFLAVSLGFCAVIFLIQISKIFT